MTTVTITDADFEQADKALEYIRETLSEKENPNDYEANLLAVASQDSIQARFFGLAASMIPFFLRETEKALKEQVQARIGANSQYFGEVGKRGDFYVTFLGAFPIESYYGTTYITKMVTKEGNLAVWFASGKPDMEEGKEYRISGGVKGHEEYKGAKQTTLTRVTVFSEEGRRLAEEKEARKAAREAKKAAKLQKSET